MKVSKGRSQPQIAAAAFLVLYMVLGRQTIFVPGFDFDSIELIGFYLVQHAGTQAIGGLDWWLGGLTPGSCRG